MSEHVREVYDHSFASDVLEAERPVLVDFWAEWCAPCRALAPTIETLAGQYAGKIDVAKMDVEAHPATAGRYGIRAIPTLILFKHGQEQERLMGAASRETIERMLQKHLTTAAV